MFIILQTLARDALDKLDTIKMKAEVEKSHYKNMDEPIPDQLTEKLEQIETLEDSIKVCNSSGVEPRTLDSEVMSLNPVWDEILL